MNRCSFKFASPEDKYEWTGERYVTGVNGQIQHEHYHRYLFSLSYCAGKDVLDVAAGEGYGSHLLGQVASSVIGVDIDDAVIAWANRHYLSERVSFKQGDASALPIGNQSIDVVVSFETIEHITEQEQFVKETARVLRPGGLLIISSPNRPVYSHQDTSANPFHLRELDKDEFIALLATQFRYIRSFEQQPLDGSAIIGTDEVSAAAVERFDSPDGTLVERHADISQAPYLIAIASREPLPVTASSIFHSPRFHIDEVGSRERRIEELRQAQTEAQRVVKERGERIATLERAYAEAERVSAEHEQARADAERLAQQRATKMAEIEQVRADAEQLAQERAAKLAELEQVRAEAQWVVDERGEKIRRLEVELETAEHGSAELARAVTSLGQRLRALEMSTTWRATSRLRAAASRLPPPVRRNMRRAIKAAYWAVTPHKMPARLKFLRARKRAHLPPPAGDG